MVDEMLGDSNKKAEIEITPAMIEAGAEEVSCCIGAGVIYAPMTEEEFAKRVFFAMATAAPRATIARFLGRVGEDGKRFGDNG